MLKNVLQNKMECVIIIGRSGERMVTGCGAVGSALDWGSRGREFKSRHSDQQNPLI